MIWRPLPSAVLFAVVGPLIGTGIVLAILAPAIRNLGPFDASAPLDLLFGAYVIGLPPLAAAGLFVGLGAQRGMSPARLLLRAAAAGLFLGALSAALFMMLGPISSPTWQLIVAVAIVSLVASVGAWLIATALFRRAPAATEPIT